MAIKIIIDSGFDMDPKVYRALNVEVIPLKVIWDGKEYRDNVDMSHEEFFTMLASSQTLPTTSQITLYEYEQAFRKYIDKGDSILCLTISSKLSGCYQNACIAASRYPGKVFVVDTLNATLGEQLLLQYAIQLRDQGTPIETIAKELEEKKHRLRLYAMVDTLEYLKKGGRLSASAAFAGTLLSIKPVITLEQGEVVVLNKCRGVKAALARLTELANEHGGFNFDMPYLLGYTGLDNSTLKKFIDSNPELLQNKTIDDLAIDTIGCVIGTHVGPGAVGFVFFEK